MFSFVRVSLVMVFLHQETVLYEEQSLSFSLSGGFWLRVKVVADTQWETLEVIMLSLWHHLSLGRSLFSKKQLISYPQQCSVFVFVFVLGFCGPFGCVQLSCYQISFPSTWDGRMVSRVMSCCNVEGSTQGSSPFPVCPIFCTASHIPWLSDTVGIIFIFWLNNYFLMEITPEFLQPPETMVSTGTFPFGVRHWLYFWPSHACDIQHGLPGEIKGHQG